MVILPALRSGSPLGFLAALGVLQLLHEEGHLPSLGWQPQLGGAAVIEASGLDDLGAVVSVLRRMSEQLAEARCALPRSGPQLPLPKPHSGPDPMRMKPADLQQRLRLAVEAGGRSCPDANILLHLVNALAVDDKGRVLTSPLHSPSGQMYLRKDFDDALAQARQGDELYSALTAWRRRPGTGANLDTRALRDAAALPSGEAANSAAWGATWLALQAVPLVRLTGDGRRSATTLWQRIPDNRGRRQTWMVYPVWTRPLDRPAVVAMLELPGLELISDDQHERPRTRATAAQLGAYGISVVMRARRQGLSNSAGALGPAERV